jgi:sugar phosphate isomerase/epimerase
MSVEDCIHAVSDLGTDGIEIIGEEGIPNFPNLSDQWVAQWFGWMDKYHTRPVCYDLCYDSNLISGRSLTLKESKDIIVRDLKLANRLGCKIVRAQRTIPADVMEACVPDAEELDVKMCPEIHAPVLLTSDWLDPYLEVIHKTKTNSIGFVVDMGIFVRRPPRVQRDWWVRRGAHADIALQVEKSYENHETKDATLAEVNKMGGNDQDRRWVDAAYGYSNNDPKDLLKFSQYIYHTHAKFYEMTDEFQEYSIPYDEIIAVLKQFGFTGYLSSEYEGQRHVNDIMEPNAVEQVRRQHVMLRRLLGESNA